MTENLVAPNEIQLKDRMNYMLTHLTATILMIACMLLAMHHKETIMIIGFAILIIGNVYFFLRHYKIINKLIEQLTASSSICLKKN